MKHTLPLLMSLFALNSFADTVAPSAVCNSVVALKNQVLRDGRSCSRMTPKLIDLYEDRLSFRSNSGEVCGRNRAVVAQILKVTGKRSCSEVTPIDLAKIDEFYVESNGKNPIRSLRHLTYRDLKGLYNATSVVFEYAYLETIEPGAFRDLRSVTNMEISHTRISYLGPETFCKAGVYGIPTLKTLDLDSNRPFKGGTIEVNLLSCLYNLIEVDFDTDEITHFPRGAFAGNKKLGNIDVKNNPNISSNEINALKSINGGITVEVGPDREDVMESWQIPESI